METFSQSDDPPGPSSSPWINMLAGAIASATLIVPLYLTIEFSRVEVPQALPTRTAQRSR